MDLSLRRCAFFIDRSYITILTSSRLPPRTNTTNTGGHTKPKTDLRLRGIAPPGWQARWVAVAHCQRALVVVVGLGIRLAQLQPLCLAEIIHGGIVVRDLLSSMCGIRTVHIIRADNRD